MNKFRQYTNKMDLRIQFIIISLLTIFIPTNAYSATANQYWSYKGNLIRGSSKPTGTCTVNSGGTRFINFGDMSINSIDGVNYTKPLPLSVVCDNGYNPTVQITLVGTQALDFQSGTILATFGEGATANNGNIGFNFKVAGVDFPINMAWQIPYNIISEFEFTVVPVKKTGANLVGGDIGATLTIKIDYE